MIRSHAISGLRSGISVVPSAGPRPSVALARATLHEREAHRRWPDEVKAQIVSESLRPGVTVNEGAERHALKANHLSSWRTLARQVKTSLP
ncbi:transposase [Rhizobium sp. SEMIA 4085]|uniref:transposase n=1 Tax=Rhizobium TaxID=379 RepID=UPI0009E18E8F|nr:MULTISPECIES: transposase [Rhizobium]NNH32541.1 transposase [Rhizobium sp. SEMIA 4085]